MSDFSFRHIREVARHAVVLCALLVAPAWLVFGTSFWHLPGGNGLILTALAATYILAAALSRSLAHRVRHAPFATVAALSAAAALLMIYGALAMAPSADYSRAVLGLGTLLLVAALLGEVVSLEKWLSYPAAEAMVGLAVVALALIYAAIDTHVVSRQAPRRVSRTISASQHTLTVTTYSHYFARQVGTVITGGALAPDPNDGGYLFARANGEIYRLGWGIDHELQVAASGSRVPLNFSEFSADVDASIDKFGFRVADIVARNEGGRTRIFVSHHFWKREQKCFVVRVSSTILPSAESAAFNSDANWQTVFESRPCLTIGSSRGSAFVGVQIGGNIEFLGKDKLLLTMGDHQFDGWYKPVNYVEDPRAHYGKTILIDLVTGESSIFTVGHRNPQGLVVDPQGRIWSTEHGPQGGDEINLLRRGGNYGYPKHTYGTEYGSTVWPPGEGVPNDPSHIRPVFAWVPSTAPTDLVVVADPSFARWRGDLLIGSLRGRAIWRVRLDGERVAYAEPIRLGHRIRDITAGKGEFVLLSDSDDIIRITPNQAVDDGAALFTQYCGGCHDDMEHRIGPHLKGVIDSRVAAGKGYDYSQALREAGGRWTEERLHEFISDPQRYVPGTSMATDGIQDTVTRQRIIDYIKFYY